MPKERSIRSGAFERKSRTSPFTAAHLKHFSSSTSMLESLTSSPNYVKEWEEVRCPVCMEYPHNAVLLQCSSRENGCRPFMCDTSYRHSNCLDQFRKAFVDAQEDENNDGSQKSTNLLCPLCRGQILDWEVVKPARRYMNAKSRSCSSEKCSFTGTYRELRKHARTEHPSSRPSDTDPERQQDWRRMEQQRDIGDLMSTLQSAIGGRTTIGLDGFVEDENDIVPSPYPFHPEAFYFVVRFRLPSSRNIEHSSRVQTRSSSRRHRQRGVNLSGETLSEEEPPIHANQLSIDEDTLSNEHSSVNVADGAQDGLASEYSETVQQVSSRRQLIILSDDDDDDDDTL